MGESTVDVENLSQDLVDSNTHDIPELISTPEEEAIEVSESFHGEHVRGEEFDIPALDKLRQLFIVFENLLAPLEL